ncbi:tetratricopeptide repeat protein [Helicobacter pylori]|uniref:tetratricopeptide repeat protein n=1 Tax=Helicobacter pylori TaxID=210 RepID=UPI0019217948|nr:tetratricopeptide repeat protein [Helicobacter pylori]QQX47740.1 sel1 repeat family protein [Helicobacter pylori]
MAEPNPEELFDLGVLSYHKQDFSKAKGYFEKACDLNNGGGCAALGDLYNDYDKGVEKNSKKAAQFYSKACELKDGRGCGALGRLYYIGEGVGKNSKKATHFCSKACKLGYKKACELLKMLKELK